MKPLLVFAILCLVACSGNPGADKNAVKIASATSAPANNSPDVNDSVLLKEKNKHGEWMTKTFYSLKKLGYNYKRAWNYIDSATKSIYKDSIPHWYEMIKRQSDSLMKERNRYKKIRII